MFDENSMYDEPVDEPMTPFELALLGFVLLMSLGAVGTLLWAVWP